MLSDGKYQGIASVSKTQVHRAAACLRVRWRDAGLRRAKLQSTEREAAMIASAMSSSRRASLLNSARWKVAAAGDAGGCRSVGGGWLRVLSVRVPR